MGKPGNEETELELSTESRSFVHRVNEQVCKIQKIISNDARNGEEHSMTLGIFITVTLFRECFCLDKGLSDIHGEEFSRQTEFHCEHSRSLTEENVPHLQN